MNRTDSQLVFQDVPVFLWFFGLIFAGIGTLVLQEGPSPTLLTQAANCSIRGLGGAIPAQAVPESIAFQPIGYADRPERRLRRYFEHAPARPCE